MKNEKDSEIYSVIDVGTNNILLLIAKSGINPVIIKRRSATSALGKGMKNGMLTDIGIKRAQKILAEYIVISKQYTKKIIVIGTSCSREAKNISVLADWLWQNYQIKYRIISGEEEANLNGLANISEFNDLDNFLLFDIGGGSTEFTFIKNRKIIEVITIPLGIRRFVNEYQDDFDLMRDKAKKLLEIIRADQQNINLVGIGGTACSLAAMKFELDNYQSEIVHKSFISNKELEKILSEISNVSSRILEKKLPFDTKRAEIIQVGTILVKVIVDSFHSSGFFVSDRGLQFGILRLDKNKIAKML